MSPTSQTILLAEEHDTTRAFLADNLTADEYRVLTTPDQAKAIALLSTAHPDLILVDVNGGTLELVDAIRSGEGLAGRADPRGSGPEQRGHPRQPRVPAAPQARRVPIAHRTVSEPCELSAKEYDLLVTLAGEPTRVFTRAELMRGPHRAPVPSAHRKRREWGGPCLLEARQAAARDPRD